MDVFGETYVEELEVETFPSTNKSEYAVLTDAFPEVSDGRPAQILSFEDPEQPSYNASFLDELTESEAYNALEASEAAVEREFGIEDPCYVEGYDDL
ncbi:MAG: hypothetical protein H8Z69_03665 [Nanohaloarchaea archaeon]|nr:hypothetical protein [Candidatus Nanohaloarchaea archaeon]